MEPYEKIQKNKIATYHNVNFLGSTDPKTLLIAAKWWKINYEKLHQYGDFTINLSNEWGDHNITPEKYAKVYNKAIRIVRKVYNGWIICDLPGWGQETNIAADASSAIKDPNIIFSVHIYPSAYNSVTNSPLKPQDLDYLKNIGEKPVIVGEFGSKASTGDADWKGLVEHAKSLGWPVLAWSWNGDGGEDNKHFMNMVKPSWVSNPFASEFASSRYFDTIYPLLSKPKELNSAI